ncbi:MAG: PEP-CTERM sorting domain-containing protein [Mojavia pulchra JT2-VF2]|jgi:hypothetical protein|uniref:PEP-CTERM sorting domain-containing protein n=1 Tax=Mojavia pulchra JT2-VF2 TaxID=287848 RepID=A0A951Q2E9_9NOST|nr:PEP-CTERM sorting domain-containing protein [Mojavia pulchra JT2-VF2]
MTLRYTDSQIKSKIYFLRNLKLWLLFNAVSSVFLFGNAAQALTFNLDGGADFNFSADTTTRAGVGSATGTINTSTGNAGFNNFFTSSYALLGAVNTGTANSTAFSQGSSSAVSKTKYTFTDADLAGNTIQINFSYAFSGTSGNPGGDALEVSFFDNIDGISVPFGNPITTLASTGVASVSFTADNSMLLANTAYDLIFQLTETTLGGTANNTAFGFDTVVIETVPIPPEGVPEPSTILGLLAGVGFISKLSSKFKSQVKSNTFKI